MLFILILWSTAVWAQDTIKIRRPNRGDEYCWVNVFAKGGYYKDTIPLSVLNANNKLELRFNETCPVMKKSDVFVASFELELTLNGNIQLSKAESSFFTEKQKSSLGLLKTGDAFKIKNMVIHAPDGFRKVEDLSIIVK